MCSTQGCPQKNIQKLVQALIRKLVQNIVACFLTGVGHQENIVPILQYLYRLPVAFWVQFKVLVWTYQALHSLSPTYLRGHLPLMPHHDLYVSQGQLPASAISTSNLLGKTWQLLFI